MIPSTSIDKKTTDLKQVSAPACVNWNKSALRSGRLCQFSELRVGMEVEWDYLYSFEYAPIIMLKCFINVYVPVHYRTVLFFCNGTTSFKRLRIVINRSILPL